MNETRRFLTLLSFCFFSLMFVCCQDSITFSPDRAPCVGDTIEMICSIVPPPSEMFGGSVATVSINGSIDFTLALLNSNDVIGGIDLSRYSANTIGLNPSAAMPVIRLIINSYLPLDSNTTFQCATTFVNGTPHASNVSDSPMRQAVPPSPPMNLTADFNSPTCSGTVQLAWTPGASDRDIEMYFLYLNGTLIASLGPVTSYNHTTTLQRDTEYTYSVVAMSCAGNSTQTAATSISVGNPPSPPMNLTADFNSPNCSGTVQLAWTPGASDRDIEMYFLYLNGVMLASLGPVTSYTHTTILQSDTEYTYSVVAMSCAGNSNRTVATSISVGNPPSSPNVNLSQTDTISCSNVLMWSTPASDRSITSYSISRDNVSIADNVSHTATEYTDSYKLDIDTTYRYSVVAISCAGSSTPIDVNSPMIEGTSLANNSLLTIRYNYTTNKLFVDWTLNSSQLISVTYRIGLVHKYTHNNKASSYDDSYIFSQISTDTNYTQSLTRPTLNSSGPVVLVITAKLSITQQCATIITNGIQLTATTNSTFTVPPANLDTDWVIIVAAVSGTLFCGSVLILTGVIILIIVCVSKKCKGYLIFNPKKRSETQELQEQMYSEVNKGNKTSKQQPVEEKMEGLYAEMDHTIPKPDNLKIPEPIEETLYAKVQQPMDGPNH